MCHDGLLAVVKDEGYCVTVSYGMYPPFRPHVKVPFSLDLDSSVSLVGRLGNNGSRGLSLRH